MKRRLPRRFEQTGGIGGDGRPARLEAEPATIRSVARRGVAVTFRVWTGPAWTASSTAAAGKRGHN
jgi:hypothetical protein